MLQTHRVRTVDQVRTFLDGAEPVEVRPLDRSARYEFVARTLRRFGYWQGKADKGVVRRFAGKVSGLSRAQPTRLIAQHRSTGHIRDRRGPPRRPFPRRYTREDIRLLAQVDALHGTLAGPATRKLCERAYTVFHDPRFERLAGISNGHLYNLRHSTTYQRRRGKVAPTRPTKVSIGERRRPHPEGRPGFVRVDTVHQGDSDRAEGLYHLNLVDEVTRFSSSARANASPSASWCRCSKGSFARSRSPSRRSMPTTARSSSTTKSPGCSTSCISDWS